MSPEIYFANKSLLTFFDRPDDETHAAGATLKNNTIFVGMFIKYCNSFYWNKLTKAI